MSGPTMARDLRSVRVHCDPVLSPACRFRRPTRFDVIAVTVWASIAVGAGFVAGIVVGGVL
ncbi:MAG TPA: hypothetical protein VFM56_10650 [Solimonas sp.]|nr:hypothetical protein [Solimonas sp.]